MKRRTLLGSLVAVTGLSGCLGAPRGGDDGGATRVRERTLRDTGRCSSPESATVDVSGGRVEVRGCITGPDGCAVARLGSATLDGDTLSVVVTTGSDAPPDTACTEALVYRGYVATVVLDGRPSGVRVVHDAPGGRRTVVEA